MDTPHVPGEDRRTFCNHPCEGLITTRGNSRWWKRKGLRVCPACTNVFKRTVSEALTPR
jgi:hypothetical protein